MSRYPLPYLKTFIPVGYIIKMDIFEYYYSISKRVFSSIIIRLVYEYFRVLVFD